MVESYKSQITPSGGMVGSSESLKTSSGGIVES